MMRTQIACFYSVLLLWGGQLGCDRAPESATLQGAVRYRGKILDHGIISFFPSAGRPIPAPIRTDGTYSVDLPFGGYEVIVIAPPKLPEGFKEGDPLPPPDPNALPAKFGRKETSGLSVKVETGSGVQTVDFSLE